MRFPFDKFKKRIIDVGLVETSYYQQLTEWMDPHENTEQSKKDFFWYLYQTMLQKVAQMFPHNLTLMYQTQRNIYLEMLGFLIEEGKDKTLAFKGIHHCDIQLAALSNLVVDIIVIGSKCCSECDKINQRVYPLNVLLKQNILPYDKCTRPKGCTCVYASIPLRDRNGRLITKK